MALLLVVVIVLKFQPVDRGDSFSAGDQFAQVGDAAETRVGVEPVDSAVKAVDPGLLPPLSDLVPGGGAATGSAPSVPGAVKTKEAGGTSAGNDTTKSTGGEVASVTAGTDAVLSLTGEYRPHLDLPRRGQGVRQFQPSSRVPQ